MTANEIEAALGALRQRPNDDTIFAQLRGIPNGQPLPHEVNRLLDREREHHRQLGQWGVVLRLLDFELERVDDGDRQVALLCQKGQLCAEELLDERAAQTAFERALAIDPAHLTPRRALDKIVALRKNWQRLVEKYQSEAESASDKGLATSLLVSAAEVVWRNEPQSERIEQLLRRALEVEPRNLRASGHLERRLRSELRYTDLRELLDQRIAVAGSRQERVAALLCAGELCENQLDDRDAAADYYRRALAIEPTSGHMLSFVVALYSEEQRWSDLVALYQDVLRAQSSGAGEAELLLQLGMVCWDKLKDVEQAERFFRRLKKLDPRQPSMLRFYGFFYRENGEHQKLLALLDAAQRLTPEREQRARLLAEMASVAEEDAKNPKRAIELWKTLYRSCAAGSDEQQRAVESLSRLYRSVEKWNALRELLKAEIDRVGSADPRKSIALQLEIAALYRDQLNLPSMVASSYNAVLALDPCNQQALEGLADHYRQSEKFAELVSLYQRALSGLSEQQRVPILSEMAEALQDRLGNPQQAADVLQQLVALQPDNVEAWTRLKSIYRNRRAWRELLDVLRGQFAAADEPFRRVLVKEIDALACGQLADVTAAIEAYNQFLIADENDEEALERLADLYRREARWPALAEVLYRRRAALPKRERKKYLALTEALARLFSAELRTPQLAIELWQEVQQSKGGQAPADVLRELYLQQGDYSELERLLLGEQRAADLVETLLDAAERADEPRARVRLQCRAAELCVEHLNDPQRAIRAYRLVVAAGQADQQTLAALAALYRQAEQWDQLLEIDRLLVNQPLEKEQRDRVLSEGLAVCQRLGDSEGSLDWLRRALEHRPDDAELIEKFERAAAACGRWDVVLDFFRKAAKESEDTGRRAELLLHVADLCRGPAARIDIAERCYAQIADIAEVRPQVLAALEQIYSEGARWRELATVLRAQATDAQEDDRRRDLLLRLAVIEEERHGELDAAIKAYVGVTQVEPDNRTALAGLERLYGVRAQWAELVDVLMRQLELADAEQDKVALLSRIAEFQDGQLHDRKAAVATYERVLRLSPEHAPALAKLERLLHASGDHQEAAAAILRPIYQQRADYLRLRRVLEILLASAGGDEQVELYREQYQLCEGPLRDADGAFAAAVGWMRSDPNDPAALTALCRIVERAGKVAELAGCLEELLSGASSTKLELASEVAVLRELARTYYERLGDATEAERYLRRLLEHRETDREALEALERILRDADRWTELRDILERACAATADPAEKRQVLLKICALDEDVIGDQSATITTYERLLELDPYDGHALRALERHCRANGRWDAVAELLARQLESASDSAVRQRLQTRIAETRARHLDDVGGAIDLLDELVSADSSAEDPVALLVELMEHAAYRQRVAEILQRVYETEQRWTELVGILLVRQQESEDREESVALLMRVGDIQLQELGDELEALKAYGEALAVDPSNSRVQEQVEALGTEHRCWSELAAVWIRALDAVGVDDLQLRGSLLMRLANLQLDRLGDVDAAIASFSEVVPLDVEDTDAAISALEPLYHSRGDDRELVELLRRRVQRSLDPDERYALLARIAELCERKLGDELGAIDAYAQMLEENDAAVEPIDALERLYLKREAWHDLADSYRRRIQLTAESAERVAYHRKLATLCEVQLEDENEALFCQLSVLDEAPNDERALSELTRLYRHLERWPELLEMLERQLPALSGERRASVAFEVARLLAEQLDDATQAVDYLALALEADPQHLEAERALEALVAREDFADSAAELLAAHYTRTQKWPALIDLRRRQAGEGEGTRRAELLLEMDRLFDDQLGDPQQALGAVLEALPHAIGGEAMEPVVERLLTLGGRTGRWSEVVDAIAHELDNVIDVVVHGELCFALGRISLEHLDRYDEAREYFERTLEDSPQHEGALAALDEILSAAAGDSAKLVQIVERRAELAEASGPLWYRLAHLRRDRLSDVQGYQQALERARECADQALQATVLDELIVRYQQIEAHDELETAIEQRLCCSVEAERRLQLLVQLAEVRERFLDNHQAALEALGAAAQVAPGDERIVAGLERALGQSALAVEAATLLEEPYRVREAWSDLRSTYELRIEALDESAIADRAELWWAVARLNEERLSDQAAAARAYQALLALDPTDDRARRQFAQLSERSGSWEPFAEALRTVIARLGVEEERGREVALQLAERLADQPECWEEAADWYGRLLDAGASDPAAGLLEALLLREERWDSLIEFYLKRPVDERQEVDYRLRAVRVWVEALDNPNAALESLESLIEHRGIDERPLVEALQQLLEDGQHWSRAAALLERRLGEQARTSEERGDLLYALADLHCRRLGDYPAALKYLQQLLALDQHHLAGVSLLEQMLLEREARLGAARLLESVYQAKDDWQRLVVIYDAQLEFIDDRDSRVALLEKIADLHQTRGGSRQLAFRALATAYEEDPGNARLQQSLESLARENETVADVLSLMSRVSERVFDPTIRTAINRRMAELYEVEQGDRQAAIAAWYRVIDLAEGDEQAYRELVRLLSLAERHADLVVLHRRRLDVAVDAEERRRLQIEIATLLEQQLDDAPAALDTWIAVREAFEDTDAVAQIERLYRHLERWRDLVQLLHERLATTKDEGGKTELLREIAYLYDEEISEPVEAIEAYRALLSLDERNLGALSALERLYRAQSWWSELIDTLQRRAELDRSGRQTMLTEAARLMIDELDDLPRALDTLEQIIAAEPGHQDARSLLERLLERGETVSRAAAILQRLYADAGDHRGVAGVLRRKLVHTLEAQQRRQLWLELAALADGPLEQRETALEAFAEAFVLDPSDRDVEAQLNRLGAGDEARLVTSYERAVQGADDLTLTKALRLRLAALHEQAGRFDEAEQQLWAALDCSTADRDTLTKLRAAIEQQLESDGAAERLLDVLQRELALVDQADERAALHVEIGALHVERYADLAAAFTSYAEALAADSRNEVALSAMQQLMSEPAYRARAAAILEPLFGEQQRYSELLGVLEQRLPEREPGQPRLDALAAIADLALNKLSDKGRALGAFAMAAAESPTDDALLARVETLAQELHSFEPAIRAVSQRLKTGGLEDPCGAALLAARWAIDREGDPDAARTVLELAAEQHPPGLPALYELERLYRATGEDDHLASALERLAERVEEPEERRRCLIGVAELAERRSDFDAALEAWSALLRIDAADIEVFDALEALLRKAARWGELIALLQRREPLGSLAERVEIRRRIARVTREKLGDAQRAADRYRSLLDLEPGDQDALDALESIYTDREDWSALQEVLVRRIDHCQDDDARLAVQMRLAELSHEQLGNDEESIRWYEQALSTRPAHRPALSRLQELLTSEARWYDLVELHERVADHLESLGDQDQFAEQLTAAARIWSAQLEDHRRAAELLMRVIHSSEPTVATLLELAGAQLAIGDTVAAQGTLTRLSGYQLNAAQRAEVECRLGNAALELQDDAQSAQEHFRRALAADPSCAAALTALERLVEAAEDWQALAALYRSRLDQVDPDERGPVLRALGQLHAEKLGRADQAIDFLRRAADLLPDDREVWRRLVELSLSIGRLDDCAQFLQTLVDKRGARPKELARYHAELAAAFAKGGDVEAALGHYEAAYASDTTHLPTMIALGEMYRQKADWQASRKIYRSMLLRDIEQAGPTRADIFLYLGQAHVGLGELERGKSMFQRGLEAEPEHGELKAALMALRELA